MTKRLSLTIAFVFVIALLSLAVFTHSPAVSQSNAPRGPFVISAANGNIVWRADQATGRVSYCVRQEPSLQSNIVRRQEPVCSGWSQ